MIDKYQLQTLKEQADLLAFAQQLTTLKKVSKIHGGEWSGPCPFCSGDDRFSIQPHNINGPIWLCRHCTDGKWQDVIEFVERRDGVDFKGALNILFGGDVSVGIDPEALQKIRAEREAAQAEQIKIEQEQQAEKRQSLHESGIWQIYHANLDKYDQRGLWHERGLTDYFIDLYYLGYCPSFYFGEGANYPTLTIPSWQADQVVGLAHRALVDDPVGGKYRPERPGLGKALFFGNPDTDQLTGKVLLLEGEIKTAVTFAHIWQAMPLSGHPLYWYELVGIAGTAWKPEWCVQFEQVSEIVIGLDPDAIDKAEKIAEQLGRERCKLIELPDKIDDLINMGAFNKDDLWSYISNARCV